jgi:hypothetical protein
MGEAAIATIDNGISKPGPKGKLDSHILTRLKEIYEWVKDGMTDYSIADNLGICHETLIKYKGECLELSSLYTRALHERNRLVMNKMFQKATGEKVSLIKQKLDKEGFEHDLMEEQYIPPDVNAADLFLRNNDPDYKGPKSVESGSIVINNFQLPQLEADLAQIAEKRKALEALLHTDYEVISEPE